MNRTLALPSALALAFALTSIGSAQVKLPTNHRVAAPEAKQAVGKASGKSIRASDLEPYLWEWYGKAALYDAMSYVIIADDAAKKKVSVTDAEVEKAIDEQVKATQKGSAPQSSESLSDQGFTRSRLYMRVKENLLLDKIVLLDFHPQNFVKVSTILSRTSTTDAAAIAKAIEKCQKAYEQLTGGQPWDQVLATVTTDPKLVAQKGSLGWRDITAFPDSIQKEITTLPAGGYTHPAQTKAGIQIFRIDEHGPDAKDKDLVLLRTNYLNYARPKYMADLKARANVQILLK